MLPDVLLTLLCGLVCGFLLLRLKVPAGMLIGAMTGACVLSLASGHAAMPGIASPAVRVLSGTFLGCCISRRDFKLLRHCAGPLAVVMASFFVLSMVMALLITALSPLSFTSALLASMPSGLQDSALIAEDFGADVPSVVLLHFVRMLFGVGILPLLISIFQRLAKKMRWAELPAHTVAAPPAREDGAAASSRAFPLWFVCAATLAAGAAGSYLGWLSSIRMGMLLGAMVGAMCLKLAWEPARLPKPLILFAQLLAGCNIGCSIQASDLAKGWTLVIPAVILVVLYAFHCVFMGYLLNRLFRYSRLKGMLVAIPAGAAEMALVAADFGIYSPDVSILHIMRMWLVIALFPQLYALLM